MQPVPKPIPVDDDARDCCVLGEVHPDALRVYVHELVLEQILDYSEQDLARELGGFLIGGYHVDQQPYVEIRQFVEAVDVQSRAASVTFTHETWAHMNRDVARRFPSEQIVGWHHTHPKLRVFLSGYDRFIHRHFFPEPWQMALVVDPVAQEFGFFQWRGAEMVDCGFVCVRGKWQSKRVEDARHGAKRTDRHDGGNSPWGLSNAYPSSRMSDETIVIDDDDRYSRLRLIGWWDQDKLARSRVMVVGAGALGNEVLKNLALVGIGEIYVVDFDRIENSNLTRSVLFRQRDCGRPKAVAAADAVRDINPDTRVIPFHANVLTDVGLGLFRDVDVVIGCLDNREARWWVNRCCWKTGTPWIDGGIQEINGVVKVFVPPDGACYECTMTENDYRLINLRYSCPLLRQEDLQAGKVPTAPTISSMIGGLQAQEAVKLIHDLPVLAGEALIYNGVANQFYRTRFQRRDDCMSHETYAEPLELPLQMRVRRWLSCWPPRATRPACRARQAALCSTGTWSCRSTVFPAAQAARS